MKGTKRQEQRIDATRPLTYTVFFIREVPPPPRLPSVALQSSRLGRRVQQEGANETQKRKKKKMLPLCSADETDERRGGAVSPRQRRLKSLFVWMETEESSEGELRVNPRRPPMHFHYKGVHLPSPSGGCWNPGEGGKNSTTPKTHTHTSFHLFLPNVLLCIWDANTTFSPPFVTRDPWWHCKLSPHCKKGKKMPVLAFTWRQAVKVLTPVYFQYCLLVCLFGLVYGFYISENLI